MPKSTKRTPDSKKLDALRRQLKETQEILRAIRSGEVDALVVSGPQGDQVYSLKDAARPFQVVIEEMNEGTLTLSDKGIILYANRSMSEILQRPLEQILGEPFAQFVHPVSQTAAGPLLDQGAAPQSKCELTLTTGKGASVPVAVSVKRVGLDGAVRLVAIVSDISERKQSEEQLRRYADELEKRVADRTEELHQTNQQLEQSLVQERKVHRELEVANKELEAFTYTVSHDLRTPLSQINELSRLVIEDYGSELPEVALNLIRLIHANADAMNNLAQELLILSRMSQQTVTKKTVSMTDLVRQVLAEMESERIGRNVEIQVADLPPAQVDPILVKQVWINLLSNSLKFTRGREVAKIEVGVFKPGDAGGQPVPGREIAEAELQNSNTGTALVYYVRDNGAGFDMQHAGRLFRAFQRLHHDDDYPGSGLGLAIVERVIRRHGGRTWAYGQPDQGATFLFSIE